MNAYTYTCKHILELRHIHAVPGLDKFKWLLNILHTFICYIWPISELRMLHCVVYICEIALFLLKNCEKNNVFPHTIGINVITKGVYLLNCDAIYQYKSHRKHRKNFSSLTKMQMQSDVKNKTARLLRFFKNVVIICFYEKIVCIHSITSLTKSVISNILSSYAIN